MNSQWRYEEFDLVGVDYRTPEEAARYDEMHARFRNVETENKALLELLNLGKGDRFIEFGCGTGEFSLAAAKAGGIGYAVDISSAMLACAREKARTQNLRSVEFVHAGFLTYEHRGKPVDHIVTQFALHHLPDYWKFIALQKMRGMLRADGLLYLLDVVIPGETPEEPIQEFIRIQELLGGEMLREDAIIHFKEEYSTFDWVVEGMLEKAGFELREKTVRNEVLISYLCGIAE